MILCILIFNNCRCLCVEEVLLVNHESKVKGAPISIHDDGDLPATVIIPIVSLDRKIMDSGKEVIIRARLTLKSALSSWISGNGIAIQMEWQDHTVGSFFLQYLSNSRV